MSARARHLAWLVLAALAVRLPLLWISPGAPFDLESYARTAACPGPGLYASAALDGRYPYLPLWWMALKALSWMRMALGGDAGVWFRLPAVAGDVAICLLVYHLVERRAGGPSADAGQRARAGLRAGLAWALNPLAILISAAHGQFDSVAVALVLGAAWLLEYAVDARSERRAALCLAAAVALKTWPLFFLPLCLGVLSSRRERTRFTAWVLIPCAVLTAPWLVLDGPAAVAARLGYSGSNALGLSAAVKSVFFAVHAAPGSFRVEDGCFRVAALALIAGAFAWTWRRARSLDLLEGLTWGAMTLVVLAPGLAPQYLVWAPALALAVSADLSWRLTLAAFPLVFGFYALFMPTVLAGASAWAAPDPGPAWILVWGASNLAWWAWSAVLWRRLLGRVTSRARLRPSP